MATGFSNTILVSDLLTTDGPFAHIAENFLSSQCAGCGSQLDHDPRHGEWEAYCATCWARSQTA